MRYLLDTNIVIILYEGRDDEIRDNVKAILMNSKNSFYMSAVSLIEISQLYRKKRFRNLDYSLIDTGDKLIAEILNELPILQIIPYDERQGFITARLIFVPNHNDPTDLAIIAHAISEDMTLISSDDKFPYYQEQGAKIIHNKR
ncbi:PIN domain-containing protein [Capnocytophaga genosp. AHN8471]|jgi:toxin-antitoxin system, toxin component, PIN family|uniref:type II toxin-antitoxin system VapC family toxin n=1 Tax=Capnocytophaga genosp. AHN8471 TaxID=327574 RepID=UPI00193315BD|nr:PIN domain-containing protein [Capnocytophaga genosp. AHN8471]MBM0652097.1 PIN domain-containing protein [Capnocytophaga genosp. AHN8471]